MSAVLVFPIGIAWLAMRTFSASELGGDLAELSDSERKISYVINRDGWQMESENRRTQTAWRHFQRSRVIRMDGGFSVLESGQETSVGLVHWFPDSAFESESAIDQFVRLVEYCEIGFIHGSRVLREPVRRRNSFWIAVGSLLEILLPFAAIVVVLRASGFSPLVRAILIAVLLIPWIRLLGRFFDHQLSIDSRLATSESRFEISVRPDGWMLSTANTRAEHHWALVARVVRFDAGFIVVENWAGQSARWLPLTGFESAAAADEFVELVRGAAVAFEDRRSGK